MSVNQSATELPITIIEPPSGWLRPNLSEVWRYRDMLVLMTLRDISVRFRQSVIGYGWAILRPLLSAIIYTLVFSVFVRVETEIPYPLFAFAGLMPWLYFSTSLTGVTGSIVGGNALLTKVYFPRLILPLSKVAVGLVELALQFLVLLGMMAWFRFPPAITILWLPLFVVMAVVTALGFGIWFTALNVKYRDIGMAVPFIIQMWMYLCPIVYPMRVVPVQYRTLYSLNPMVGVVEGFRWSLFGTTTPDWGMISLSLVSTILVLITGIIWFRRVETTFADII